MLRLNHLGQYLVLVVLALFSTSLLAAIEGSKPSQSESVFHLLGKTQYSKLYPVISNFDGRVEKVFVRAGEALVPDQPLVTLNPFNPNLKNHQVVNTLEDSHVIEVERKEGHRVGQYETVITLASRSDLVVEAYALDTQIGKLELNQAVHVELDAGGLEVPLSGHISAIHEMVDETKAALKFEVSLKITQCVRQAICLRLLRSGVIAKLTINDPLVNEETIAIARESQY